MRVLVTVLELIRSFQNASGVLIKCQTSPRRIGDLPAFWSDASLAYEKLSWKPKFTIDQMCTDI